jgi:inosine-uridine nucleoside N-ribohydrolase
MTRKVVVVADPGIDGAFAVALALYDPSLEVLALAGTPGNVPAEQATHNLHILVDHLAPARWPKIGAAPPIELEIDGTVLHGPGGLGAMDLPCAPLHHVLPAEKLICDLVNQHRGEVTLVCLGPLTAAARALDRDPDLAKALRQIVVVGGTWQEAGNAGAVAEFHFFCDPLAARTVLHCGAVITVIPLDVSRKALFSPTELTSLPGGSSRAGQFLRKIVPYGISATAQLYGIEGFHLKDLLGVAFLSVTQAFKTKPMTVDVETRGDLTRGMMVVDQRPRRAAPNVDLALDVDMAAVRAHVERVFARLAEVDE